MELELQEGTTQGDNIAMAYYAIGMNALMERLEAETIVQEWFADDAACLGELLRVKKWWDQINGFDAKYGFFPKAYKCWLICESEEMKTEANRFFQNTGLNITQTARKHLGAVVGEIEYCRMSADDKTKTWRNQVCA